MSKTVLRKFLVEGVLTDVTTAKLSDPTGTYGVKRDDTDEVVVADGTAMTKQSTGIYTYTFDEPEEGLAYTAYVEFVYDGAAYHIEHDIPAVTSEESALTVTYEVLRREVGFFLGYGHQPSDWEGDATVVADVAAVIRSGVRRVLVPPPLSPREPAHKWSWLSPVDTFTTTAPYTTGTVEIVSGVATISDGSWPSWATQGELTVTSGRYSVESVDGTALTLSDTSVDEDAGTTFSLARVAYDLPADFADIEGPLIAKAGQSLLVTEVKRASEYRLLERLHADVLTGAPRIYCTRPKPVDMTGVTRYELLICPAADGAYQFHYHYRVRIEPLGAVNTTPPGGDEHGELYLEACLAVAEERFHDRPGSHSETFDRLLTASISHDREVACPDTLGCNRDLSDEAGGFDPDNHWFTDTGIVRPTGYEIE